MKEKKKTQSITKLAEKTFQESYIEECDALDCLRSRINNLKQIQKAIPLCPNEYILNELQKREKQAKDDLLLAMRRYDIAIQEFKDILYVHEELVPYYHHRPIEQDSCQWLIIYGSLD